ncbi:MAG: EamA family transporter [Candidatus Kerfeldbacteria bacterium]|nr:EamA family transporter [Candidatus Kerfeldbacteria bacterium]
MNWIIAVLIGHFFNAISFVLDKIVLTKSIKDPYAFTFHVGLLGLISLVFIPFGFELPSNTQLALNLCTGIFFALSLLTFFLALASGETSRVVPFIGAAIPIFTLILEILFLHGQFSLNQLFAFGVLVFGTFFITLELKKKKPSARKHHQQMNAWILGIIAALFFAICFVMTKAAFDHQPFLSAFIWMRIGTFLFVLIFLLVAKHRKNIMRVFSLYTHKEAFPYMGSQLGGGIGFLCVNYAISLAPVALVNAMQGVQYAFLLIMAMIGSIKYPQFITESMTQKELVLKSIAVIIIGAGLALVAINA